MMNLDPDQPDFDTKMLDYLSQFPLDDIDNEYIARNTMGRSRVAPNEIAGVRKIRQLKILITSMMADEIRNGEKGTGFGRYCYYGCHCLPDKHHNEYLTFGKPVDNIDKQCKQMGVCYKCLQHKYPESQCLPENTNYKFALDQEKKTIDCSLNKNECRRDVCECDKQFAQNVAKYEFEWNEEFHIKVSFIRVLHTGDPVEQSFKNTFSELDSVEMQVAKFNRTRFRRSYSNHLRSANLNAEL